MRANEFKAGAHQAYLDRMVRTYDGRTRAEGFHVLKTGMACRSRSIRTSSR